MTGSALGLAAVVRLRAEHEIILEITASLQLLRARRVKLSVI